MPDLADGETVEMKGSGAKPYQFKPVSGRMFEEEEDAPQRHGGRRAEEKSSDRITGSSGIYWVQRG